MLNEVQIEELQTYTQEEWQLLETLMQELSPASHCNQMQLVATLQDANAHLYVVRMEGQIVGCATLCVMHTLEMTIGDVEAVVVRSDCRGLHLGRLLMEHVLQEAKNLGVDQLHLTSNPQRIAANRLYQAMGFQLKATNCYQLVVISR